jgi:hypothetical protein
MTKKDKISLAKAVNLFLWHQLLVLALMTGAFSVSLSVLEVDVLDCVEKDDAPLCWTAERGVR